jgi:serine kinase of HPr protein (carbohydrate metabolism regulator)
MASPSIHASAVLIGSHAMLIRGPSGSGKSRLALALLQTPCLPFTRLVGDDRVHVQARNGRLLVRPAATLEGLIEVRGLGIRKFPFEPVAVVKWIIDLAANDAERLPPDATVVTIEGIRLARLAVAPSADAGPLVLEALRMFSAAAS